MTSAFFLPKAGDVVIYKGRCCRVGHTFACSAAPVSGWLVELEPHTGIGLMNSGAYLGYVDAAVLKRCADDQFPSKVEEDR